MLKSMLAFVIAALFTGWLTFSSHADDDIKFAQLTESSDNIDELTTYCQQFREGVSKEISINDQTCMITSDRSELTLAKKDGNFEVTEHSDRVHVTFEDNQIDAKDACYNYTTNTLITQATVLTKQEMVVKSDEACYDGHTLILDGNVSVDSQMGQITADKAVIDLEAQSASKITLTGHVNMINSQKTQYAIADHVEFFPDEKVMIFEADKRVLFYDREKKMQLSAKKIRAQRGEEDEVQGYGNVCFIFDTQELDKFKKQFKWES